MLSTPVCEVGMRPEPVLGSGARKFSRGCGARTKNFFNTLIESTHHTTARRIFFPYMQLIAPSSQQSSWVFPIARLAQSVERETLNLKVVGSTPTSGSIPVSD
ncbi:hypothetical protein GQ607_015396 [Colletotrichum asianum]|uniref:Uncharacterized protein n=1 Tax=Colletotrichum asianum TaxID=702518 RepID=A0A8H3ZF55_9PEZI|nr:hypothetical protein GQ607_015396 [Colletotrichum asianum]